MALQQAAPVARQLSVRAVMAALLKAGPTSRATLAKLTGLSRQTTTQVVLELQREGWLRVVGRIQGPVGRSAPTYELNPGAAFVLGIRLEGRIVEVALANIQGERVAELSEPTAPEGGAAVVRQIGRLYRALLARAAIEPARVRVAMMGSPGVVDPRTGHIGVAPSVPHLDDMNVVEALGTELGLSVAIENGVKLAALGELWQGAARGVRDFCYFAIGSGVGMGIVSEGRLLRGARGAAGEIAYLPLGGDPFLPANIRNGTFEVAANSGALLAAYVAHGGTADRALPALIAGLRDGDAAADAAVTDTARTIALAVAAVAAVVDPALIVVGGSVGLHPILAEKLRAALPGLLQDPPNVRTGALGDRATLVGALGTALNRLHEELFGVAAVEARIFLGTLGGVTRD